VYNQDIDIMIFASKINHSYCVETNWLDITKKIQQKAFSCYAAKQFFAG